MKTRANALHMMGAFLAPLALALAFLTSNSTCFFLSYQPDEPANLKEMISRQARMRK
jgi:hypothetical protein